MEINFDEVKVGDIFSELTYYVVTAKGIDFIEASHVDGGKEIVMDDEYVKKNLKSADLYSVEIIVGREDDRDGPGIRTIWEGINSKQVFTVCFQEQDRQKTKKEYESELKAQREAATEIIERARRNKKSMAQAYIKALQMIQNNPITPLAKGEDMVLRGYKLDFVTRDGKYQCVDMDTNAAILVNINTIKWLIFDGVKYIVE